MSFVSSLARFMRAVDWLCKERLLLLDPTWPRHFLSFLVFTFDCPSSPIRLGRSSIIRLRALFLSFFHCLHSSFVRRQPIHKPVLSSNLQMLMQGDSTAIMLVRRAMHVRFRYFNLARSMPAQPQHTFDEVNSRWDEPGLRLPQTLPFLVPYLLTHPVRAQRHVSCSNRSLNGAHNRGHRQCVASPFIEQPTRRDRSTRRQGSLCAAPL